MNEIIKIEDCLCILKTLLLKHEKAKLIKLKCFSTKHSFLTEKIMTTENQYESIESVIVARALKDEAFKQQLLTNPATALVAIEQELEESLPEGFSVNVVEETPNTAYIVLPYTASTEEMSEEQLESVAGGHRLHPNLHKKSKHAKHHNRNHRHGTQY